MPNYLKSVPDPSGNASQTANTLASASASLYARITLKVVSTTTPGKSVYVLNMTNISGTPTMQDVVDNGFPFDASEPLILNNNDIAGANLGVDPSRLFLAMVDGDGDAEVRAIA